DLVRSYPSVVLYRELLGRLYSHVGACLFKKGQLDAALREFQTALEVNPKYPYAHANLAIALTQKGDLEGAARALQAAIRLRASFAPFHYQLGGVLSRLGEIDRAVTQYEEACRLDPQDTAARALLTRAKQRGTLFARLPSVLAYKDQPKSPVEA